MKRALLCLILAFAPMPAFAQSSSDSGSIGYLRRQCMAIERVENGSAANSDGVWGGWCLGYVVGAANGADAYAYAMGNEGLCPRQMSADQIRAVFVNWANRHPEHWDAPAAWGVVSAMLETCAQ